MKLVKKKTVVSLNANERELDILTIDDVPYEAEKIVGGTVDYFYPKYTDSILDNYRIGYYRYAKHENKERNIAVYPEYMSSDLSYADILYGTIFVTALEDGESVKEEDLDDICLALDDRVLVNPERNPELNDIDPREAEEDDFVDY